jgi:AraC-like DNA-binding protein
MTAMETARPAPSTIPAPYLARWIALLESRGARTDDVLAGAGVMRAAIDDPHGLVTMDRVLPLFELGVTAVGDPGLALELGFAITPLSHGLLSVALMSCGTLRVAVDLVDRYLKVRAYPLPLHIFRDGDAMVIQFDDELPRGLGRQLVVECVLAASLTIGTFLLDVSLQHPDIEFRADFAEPAHHARFRAQLPRMRYGCPHNEGRFPYAWLDRRLSFDADPEAQREALEVLEPQRRLVEDEGDWLARTRALLADPAQRYPSLDAVAGRLAVSARSLRRYFARRGLTYHALRDDARRSRAITLLEHSDLELVEIADQLGYSDAAAFGRAYRRWTGTSPTAARLAR